ncbi:glutamate 5-kinase [Gilvimarinus agarilyticus]|uniref:glutamate 5-kinase n=1 Tax=unclassified Gilvimarinus TaxID=2642066 RepID=UPI001C094BCE|nr:MULTISPECIES: glutamate 5-kinase [unclassified Gilvimarinus]MBU2886024.1 glutamate 5-kinase [Gilvimarinus agarilyticus]MDO6570770.1 glutamate 5-kinase [Gilvimarinus sp. 2_MG-2023]MDO6747637.1 glutamate 5-kinase [Gilvimarinus sp. 1_MG-2023]
MSKRQELNRAQRWVVKIGSALLTNDGKGLDYAAIAEWVAQIAALKKSGIELVLVSSGAVAAGMTRLGWNERPTEVHLLQAAAAVGQMGLVQNYQTEFSQYGLHTAQVLLDHDDLSSRERYLNARSTLRALLDLNVIPIVNENDTVVTDEIRFGDNDTLGALVANLIDADVLVIMTDQDGMYTADPRSNPDAQLISEMAAADDRLSAMAGDGGSLGRGGMITKVRAAKVAARSGADTIIVGGRQNAVLTRLHAGEALGTLLWADQQPQAARKRWLAGHLQSRGTLILDDGAVGVLQKQGKSLLPVGVREVQGDFKRGEMVVCKDLQGREIGRGLVNYHATEAAQIIGLSSSKIVSVLGYQGDEELIHRDNMVIH